MAPETKQPEEKDDLVEVWRDTVSLKDLLVSLLICLVLVFGGYLLTPYDDPYPLIFGLTGTIVGFLIISLIFRPKRTTHIKEE